MYKHINLALFLVLFWQSLASAQDGTALVFRPADPTFDEVVQGMEDDIGEDVAFSQITINKSASVSVMATALNGIKPDVVVLVGNRSLNLYASYQAENEGDEFPPAIGLAALFVDSGLEKIDNATGIRYEIPAVTSVVNLRNILGKPVTKVGVVYREWMQSIIDENAAYCRSEGIELVGYKVPNKDSKMEKKVASALKKLAKEDVEAIWLLNDNALLNGTVLGKAWIPSLGSDNLPVIVGVKSLLATKFNLGTFAVVPDHYGLGVQAASIIGDLLDEDWDLDGRDVEQPLSVKKIINTKLMDKKKIAISKTSLSLVDEVISQ